MLNCSKNKKAAAAGRGRRQEQASRRRQHDRSAALCIEAFWQRFAIAISIGAGIRYAERWAGGREGSGATAPRRHSYWCWRGLLRARQMPSTEKHKVGWTRPPIVLGRECEGEGRGERGEKEQPGRQIRAATLSAQRNRSLVADGQLSGSCDPSCSVVK